MVVRVVMFFSSVATDGLFPGESRRRPLSRCGTTMRLAGLLEDVCDREFVIIVQFAWNELQDCSWGWANPNNWAPMVLREKL